MAVLKPVKTIGSGRQRGLSASLPPIEEEPRNSPRLPLIEFPRRKRNDYGYIFFDEADEVDRKDKMKRILEKQRTVIKQHLSDTSRSSSTTVTPILIAREGPSPRVVHKRPPPARDHHVSQIIDSYLTGAGKEVTKRHAWTSGCPCCVERNYDNYQQQRGRENPGFEKSYQFYDDGSLTVLNKVRGYPTPYQVARESSALKMVMPQGVRNSAPDLRPQPQAPKFSRLGPILSYSRNMSPALREELLVSATSYDHAINRLQNLARSFRS